MAVINRVRVALTGLVGLPGVSTFYCLSPSSFLAPLRSFYEDNGVNFPAGISVQVENVGDTVEATTGDLTGSWSSTVQAPTGGVMSGAYAAPAGVAVNWLTDVVADGHRVRGRTFLVPLGSGSFDLTGSIEATALVAFKARADALVAAVPNNFVVWHRPFAGSAATPTRPARPAHSGSFAFVTASSVADKVAVLRSRRD